MEKIEYPAAVAFFVVYPAVCRYNALLLKTPNPIGTGNFP